METTGEPRPARGSRSHDVTASPMRGAGPGTRHRLPRPRSGPRTQPGLPSTRPGRPAHTRLPPPPGPGRGGEWTEGGVAAAPHSILTPCPAPHPVNEHRTAAARGGGTSPCSRRSSAPLNSCVGVSRPGPQNAPAFGDGMKVKTRSPGWTPMPWHRVLVRRGDESTDTPRDEQVGGGDGVHVPRRDEPQRDLDRRRPAPGTRGRKRPRSRAPELPRSHAPHVRTSRELPGSF